MIDDKKTEEAAKHYAEENSMSIEVKDDRVLLGAYENGKIERKLFFINKEQLELLINGLMAVNVLIHNEVDFSQFIYQGK